MKTREAMTEEERILRLTKKQWKMIMWTGWTEYEDWDWDDLELIPPKMDNWPRCEVCGEKLMIEGGFCVKCDRWRIN